MAGARPPSLFSAFSIQELNSFINIPCKLPSNSCWRLSAAKKTNSAKKDRLSQTQGEQEQARNQLPNQNGQGWPHRMSAEKMGRNHGKIQ
jgi:hypothetical protein